MDPLYIKLGLSVLGAAVVLYFMQRAQKRKEERAQKQFEQTLKSRGMSLDVLPKVSKNETPKKKTSKKKVSKRRRNR